MSRVPPARVPKYLHLPTQILWFDPEEIGLILGLYAIWLVVDSWIVGAAGLVGIVVFKSVKAERPRGFVQHELLYLGVHKLEGYPPIQIEEFWE